MRTLRLSLVGTVTMALLGWPGSAVVVAAQEEADAPQLVIEEVEPGVERIISDGFGHDLDETHPNHRYDMDGIAVAPDGVVWLTTTHHGSDNPGGPHLWVLGQPDTYVRGLGLPTGEGVPDFVALADGTLLAFAGEPYRVRRFDGERFVPDYGPVLRPTADGGLLLLLQGADLSDRLSEGQVSDIPTLYAVWDGGRWAWLDELGRTGVDAGDHWCWLDEGFGWGEDGGGVSCATGSGGWLTGEPITYLAGTFIGQLAAAPDGSVWAVGDYDGGPGGLYRITLPEPDVEQRHRAA
jgi:hypothetical protein